MLCKTRWCHSQLTWIEIINCCIVSVLEVSASPCLIWFMNLIRIVAQNGNICHVLVPGSQFSLNFLGEFQKVLKQQFLVNIVMFQAFGIFTMNIFVIGMDLTLLLLIQDISYVTWSSDRLRSLFCDSTVIFGQRTSPEIYIFFLIAKSSLLGWWNVVIWYPQI